MRGLSYSSFIVTDFDVIPKEVLDLFWLFVFRNFGAGQLGLTVLKNVLLSAFAERMFTRHIVTPVKT